MGKAIDASQWLSLLISFALVIVLLLGTLWVIRRMSASGLRRTAGRRITVVDNVWLGNRQRIALLRVDEREILVGVSAQGIHRLDAWERSAESASIEGESQDGTPAALPVSAQARFVDALRGLSGRSSEEGRR